MHACMHVCLYVCMHACMDVCTYIYKYIVPDNTANLLCFWPVLNSTLPVSLCHQGTGVMRSMRGMHGTARDGLKDFASASDTILNLLGCPEPRYTAPGWNRGGFGDNQSLRQPHSESFWNHLDLIIFCTNFCKRDPWPEAIP